MRSLNIQVYLLIAVIVLTALTGLIGLLIALLQLRDEKMQRITVRGRHRKRLKAEMATAHGPRKA